MDLTVNQILTGIAVSPMSASITAGGTQQFTVTGRDQFDQPISNPPVTWTLTGPGSLSGNGLYTPAYAPGTATVQATSGACVSSASVTITGSAQWNSSADASWSASGSWADSASQAIIAAPGVRGIAGDTILFAGATGSTVRLDGASPTLADITFNSDATSYTIAQGSGGTLTLQCNAGAAVNVLAGSDAIGAPLDLASNTSFAIAAGSGLALNDDISGSGSLTKTGPGTLVLANSNGYSGGVSVLAGKVVVNYANSLADGSNLIVGDASLFARATGANSNASPPAMLANATIWNADRNARLRDAVFLEYERT